MTRKVYDWAVPSIKSLRHFNPDVKVHVLCEDDNYPLADETINVNTLDFFRKNGPNYNNRFTYINLYRPAFASVFQLDRVLYLDVDTIICDSLKALWETDLTGKWYGMVPEYKGQFRPYGDLYYNAGVTIYNLKQMREDGASERFIRELNCYRYIFPDQDILNQHVDKAVTVELRFNENFATGATDNPAIVHYAGYANWWTDKVPRHEYLDAWR